MNIKSNKRVLLKRSLKHNLSSKLIVTSLLLYKFTNNDAACCEFNTEQWEMFLTNECMLIKCELFKP